MNLSIQLIDNDNPTNSASYPFPIDVEALQEALQYTAIGPGTMTEPIAIDDFITSVKNKLPQIGFNTTVKASFELLEGDEGSNATPMVCCKVQNIGRTNPDFKNWEKVFDCDGQYVRNAPDGTLYVTPQEISGFQSYCEIRTLKQSADSPKSVYILYSVLFKLIIDDAEGNHMTCYCEFDPLAKISSNV